MWQTNYSKACQIIKLGTLLCAVLSLAINTMYLQEQTINLYPLEATGPLADKTFTLYRNEGRWIAGEASALFGDLPVSHLHF